jgi:hypothetical protein
LTIFPATFAAALLAGTLMLVGVREYVNWSIRDPAEQIDKRFKEGVEKARK